jgi:plastocyanin
MKMNIIVNKYAIKLRKPSIREDNMRKALMILALTVLSNFAYAEVHNIDIVDFSFSPQNLTVMVGDTVIWTNQDNVPHTSTSDTGIWDSGTLTNGQTFMWMFNSTGDFPYHCTVHPSMTGMISVQPATGIDDRTGPQTPTDFSLMTNYPNPFNASTTIEFETKNVADTKLEVYDIVGRLVDVLQQGAVEAGIHKVVWNADVPSGVYFYRLTIDGQAQTKAMTLLK